MYVCIYIHIYMQLYSITSFLSSISGSIPLWNEPVIESMSVPIMNLE